MVLWRPFHKGHQGGEGRRDRGRDKDHSYELLSLYYLPSLYEALSHFTPHLPNTKVRVTVSMLQMWKLSLRETVPLIITKMKQGAKIVANTH